MDDSTAHSFHDAECSLADGAERDSRLSAVERRLQQQDNELTVVKAALADALRRLAFYDRHFGRVQDGGAVFTSPLGLTDQMMVSYDQTQTQTPVPELSLALHGSPSSASARQSSYPGTEAVPCVPALYPGVQALASSPKAPADPPLPALPRDEACLGPDQPASSETESGGSEEPRAEDRPGLKPLDEAGSGGSLPAQALEAGPEDAVSQPGIPDPGRPDPPEPEAAQGPGRAAACLGHRVVPVPEEEPGSLLPDLGRSPLDNAGKKTVLLRRCSTSDKLRGPRDGAAGENHRPRLAKKSASSQSLLSKGRKADGRNKEPPQSPVTTSRRGFYNQEGVSIKVFLRGRPITMYVPLQFPNYDELRMELPAEKLKLDWVYGYRGRDSRDNLHLLPSGEVVYFIACVVVLYSIEDQTQRHYLKHTDCVRCLAVHPDGVRIASGQAAGVDKDGKPLLPCVHIWDSVTLQTLQHIGLGSFERGVGSLAFSKADKGAFLCVIDDSSEHLMSVWDCTRGTRQAETKATNEAVLQVEFNPTDSSCIVSCGKSHVYFWTWSGSSLTKKQGIFGKYKKPKFIQCFVFMRTGEVLTGDSEGNILVWGKAAADIKTLGKGAKETYQIARQVRAHEGSIFTLCIRGDGALLSGGGKDRKVILWGENLSPQGETEVPECFGAVRTLLEAPAGQLLIGTTKNAILSGGLEQPLSPIVQGHTDELWGLATHPFHDLFLTCAHDRQVCVWNHEQHTLAWSRTLEGTGLCASFHGSGSVVVVGLQDGRWVVLDCQTKEDVWTSVDGNEQLSVVRYSPDGNFLAVGSHDNYIYLHTVSDSGRKYSRYGRCTGHSSFITHLDWSQDSRFIMSNSGDYEILYWDIAAGCKLIRNRYECKDLEWVSYTCVLGFHVFGVWPDGSDGTDINALCRSHNERLVAVADDFCKVHLFQYPCSKAKAPSHVYSGHGSHVTNVCFTHNDTHLISTGGKDTTVMQWRVLNGGLERSTSISSASASSLDIATGSNT
ncbi:echinoderm microtubule-associated protein-like 4 isoform X1 [Mobula hypostoma]|uniref:echinoderm microtubule-associated protein-like 4 isoform X1 n=1 Tax=Mobula hypostoma TaxID=723540 RepID=UPI002FC3BD7A